MNFNIVDLLILIAGIYFIWQGVESGLISGLLNLVVGILAFLYTIIFYPSFANILTKNFNIGENLAAVAAFFILLILLQTLGGLLVAFFYNTISSYFNKIKFIYFLDKFLGAIPSLVFGLLLITLLLLIPVILPFKSEIKDLIVKSWWGKNIIPAATKLEPAIEKLAKRLPTQNLFYLITPNPDSAEKIELTFPEKIELKIDEVSESKMIELLNNERAKVGAKPLKIDPTIVKVTRSHSLDMFQRRYFSHYTPEGLSPFDRMGKGGVSFLVAGENLAYAPTVEIAHQGLMNSRGHRENIMRPEFGRVGIGVIDGGLYGEMFTQNFAD